MNKQENDTKSDQTSLVLSDAEIAANLKAKIINASTPLLQAMEEAKRAGFEVNIGFGFTPIGTMTLTHLTIAKYF